MRNFHFESINKITLEYKAFPTSTLNFEHDSTCEDVIGIRQHIKKLKHEEDIGGNQGSKDFKPLFVGTKTFIQIAKKGDAFFCMPF
jgi:hypothetical protein